MHHPICKCSYFELKAGLPECLIYVPDFKKCQVTTAVLKLMRNRNDQQCIMQRCTEIPKLTYLVFAWTWKPVVLTQYSTEVNMPCLRVC